jgi:hypothetical protein
MKKQSILSKMALTLLGVCLLSAPARATLTYNPGDIFIGFFATGGTGATLDYIVNLGQASQYTTGTAAFNLSTSGIGADLTTAFGAGWSTRSDLYWGLFGVDFNTHGDAGTPRQTLYASNAELTLGTQATAFNRATAGVQGNVGTSMNNVATAYTFGNNAPGSDHPTTNPVGLIQAVGDPNSYGGTQSVDSLTSFGAGTSLIGGGWNTFENGAATQAADLFKLAPKVGGGTQPGTYQGTFTINGTSGAISFQPTPVPEPSTYGLMIGAAAILLVVVRKFRRPCNA